jgi:signal transduction histidine kinase
MTGVLVVALTVSLVITDRTLTQSAEDAIAIRLARATQQLASSIARGTDQRGALEGAVANDSAVRRLLRSASANPERSNVTGPRSAQRVDAATLAAARISLGRLTAATDSGLPIELWSEAGRRLIRLGTDSLSVRETPPPELSARRDAANVILRADSARVSEFYASRGRVFFEIALPIYENGRRIGYITQQHRVAGGPDASKALRELIGEDVTPYFRNRAGPFWSTLGGIPADAPEGNAVHDTFYTADRPGIGQVMVADAPITGTPWAISLELPTSVVAARSRATMVRLGLFSLLLVVVGAAASWLISKRITHPLAALSAAAEGLALGDYSRPVDDVGGDEVARLAKTFNRMRQEIGATHRELEAQVEEAQAVTEELEQTNEELLMAKDSADIANKAKSDFLAVMSHELRTPLNAIGGYMQLIALGVHGPVTPAQEEALARADRSQQRLLMLINDVLNFAKLDAGRVHYNQADVALDAALSGLEAVIAPQARAKALRYRYASCDPSLTAHADHDKIQQVVLNLLSNAIKFTPEGGTITVNCDASDTEARIQVHDTGVGISVDRARAVFDPFVQVDRALNRPHDGVGLGLSISRDLARGMGGDLVVDSVPGQGSTFTLTLPRVTSRQAAAQR